ncbi:hypothetical protein A9K71_17740 [Mesorhizobium sp. WSM3873]|nr:hypothetical protein A9K71_17740 [Mesorhizobium sp. WSM3873]
MILPLNELVELVAAFRAHDRIGCRHAGDQPVPAKGGCDRGCETGVAFRGRQKRRAAELEMIAATPSRTSASFRRRSFRLISALRLLLPISLENMSTARSVIAACLSMTKAVSVA